MKPIQPSSKINSTILGFAGISLIFIGIFHFIFTEDLTLEKLASLENLVDLAAPILGSIFIFYARRPDQINQEEKLNDLCQSPTTINLMTGVSYFFLTIIGLFIIIPVIALVWMKATGNL